MGRIPSWTIIALLIIFLIISVTLPFNPTTAEGQSSYELNSIWVSPSTISYSQSNATVGMLFNVTVWAYIQNDTYNWQVTMNFDASVFQCVACGYTAGQTSAFFAGHLTIPVTPVIDSTGGSILFGESLINPTDYAPPKNASLMYAEFNITTMPTPSTPSYTGVFDINATGTQDTFFDGTTGNTIVSAANLYDATFILIYAGHTAPPTISNVTQVPDMNNVNVNEAVVVSANVTDNSGTGIANITIVYSFDSWTINSTAPMTMNTTTGFYEGTIPGYGTSGIVLDYTIQVYDNSGGFTELAPFLSFAVLPEYAATSLLLIIVTMSVVAFMVKVRKQGKKAR